MKRYIGNIVANPKFKVEECFKKCYNLTDIDDSLPTLIIGLQNAKKYINDFNILKKRYIDNMLWWTFTKTERRIDYEKDIVDFHNHCINTIVNKIDYHYINFINLTYNKAKCCLNYINSNNKKYYYIDNNKFIFVFDTKNVSNSKSIYGFSLNTGAFFGIARNKVISLFENNPNNVKINNFYSIPNKIRGLVNDDIPSEMILLDYF